MNHLVSKEKDRQKIRRQFWRSFISSLIIFALVVLVLEWKRGFSHLSFSDLSRKSIFYFFYFVALKV